MSERLVPVDDLVTIDEIAKRLRWSVNATANVVTGRDGRNKLKFPRPLVGRGKRGVWLWTDVWRWYEKASPRSAEARKRAGRAAAMKYTQNWKRGRYAA